ncbi:GATA transcription factor 9 [Sesamum angolense]|uniref:GATA transcription factor n=1 Tax=Sesamum angolense TaxID=2727404 RepID=A0AAE2BRU9_9LAMI|nr:GATA transcription factor 9 [Sesamum angolense]
MEYFSADYAEFSSPDNLNFNTNNNNNNGVHFTVDDLLDFSKEDETMTDAFFDSLGGNSARLPPLTAVIPRFLEVERASSTYDDLAELEWLSNFVEESFSTDDLHFIPTTNGAVAAKTSATDTSSSVTTTQSPPIFPSDVSVPGKARSKRSRAAPCDWSSRLLLLSNSPSSNPKTAPSKLKREATESTPGRKCLHCASEKTPQWRTGPMGPKTLCNACGVRYKSGRLVPEYRPAASPTFVSTKHSNSHRKVLELRRQKDLQRHHHHQQLISQASIFNGCDEFLIHHRSSSSINGPDLRHMI